MNPTGETVLAYPAGNVIWRNNQVNTATNGVTGWSEESGITSPVGSIISALAWTTKHPMVSSVITGASRPSQVVENFEAMRVVPLITDEVKDEMERAVS